MILNFAAVHQNACVLYKFCILEHWSLMHFYIFQNYFFTVQFIKILCIVLANFTIFLLYCHFVRLSSIFYWTYMVCDHSNSNLKTYMSLKITPTLLGFTILTHRFRLMTSMKKLHYCCDFHQYGQINSSELVLHVCTAVLEMGRVPCNCIEYRW